MVSVNLYAWCQEWLIQADIKPVMRKVAAPPWGSTSLATLKKRCRGSFRFCQRLLLDEWLAVSVRHSNVSKNCIRGIACGCMSLQSIPLEYFRYCTRHMDKHRNKSRTENALILIHYLFLYKLNCIVHKILVLHKIISKYMHPQFKFCLHALNILDLERKHVWKDLSLSVETFFFDVWFLCHFLFCQKNMYNYTGLLNKKPRQMFRLEF